MFLLLVTVVPAVTFLPSAAVVATGGEHGPPTSTVAPLPEFTTSQVVTISYTSFKQGQGSGGDDDGGSSSASTSAGGGPSSGGQSDGGNARFWTELFFRTSNESAWALYMPPWDPDGRWFGVRDPQHEGAVTGLIPFDTFYTGGETHYGFTTVAVHTKYGREALGGEKAHTTVDSHAPQLFIATPTPGAWTSHNVLHWIAQDASSGVARVAVSLDGATPSRLRRRIARGTSSRSPCPSISIRTRPRCPSPRRRATPT